MAASNKQKDKRIADLEAQLAKGSKTSKPADDYDEDEDDFDDEEIAYDKNELRWFLIENEGAKEYRKDIESVLGDYPNMSFQDALTFAKAKTPQESKSSSNFSTR